MKAIFYLLNLSFEYNPNISLLDLENAIMWLADDYDFVKKNNDEIHRHESVYDIEIFEGYKIMDMNYPDKKSPLKKDIQKFLQKIIINCKSTTYNNTEIIELINWQEKENLCENKECYGLFALLNTQQQINPIYIVHNKRNWLEFHIYFLSKFPCDTGYFIDECNKYFTNLFIHERNKEIIKKTEGEWKNSVITFLHHLKILNNEFPKYLSNRQNYQRIEVLKNFGSENNIEVSPQGNAEEKKFMTFTFDNQDICCEPHIKISKNDIKGNHTNYFNRIYFYEGKDDIQNGKILVGHIGKHIDF